MEMIAGDPGIMNLSGNSPGPDCLGLPGPYLKVQLLLLTPAPTGGDTSPASGSARQNTASQSQSQQMSSMCHNEHRRGCTDRHSTHKIRGTSLYLGQGQHLDTSRMADFFYHGVHKSKFLISYFGLFVKNSLKNMWL